MTALRAAGRALAHEDFTRGRDLLLAAVDGHPDWADAWALLSGAQLALADVDAACYASERALALAPDAFLPRMKAGELALRLGDIETAEVQFLAAVRATEPDTPDALAARKALVIARLGTRSGIAHRASLPNVKRIAIRIARPVRTVAAIASRIRGRRVAREAT